MLVGHRGLFINKILASMGSKKSRRNQVKPKKRKGQLESRFNCPECNNENVVQCKVERRNNKGTAFCTVCEASFGCRADNLTQPIDVYSTWIDELNK